MSFGYGFGLPSWQPLSGGFNPSSLFVGGVQGTWFDPSDPDTLFSDTAGTTPSPTPGGGALSVVGLMLDKSQGLALGSELVTNGDFSNGTTGWTAYASTLSVSGGEVTVTNSGVNYGEIYQTVTTVVGQMYKISATLRVGTAATVNLRAETALTAGNLFQQTTSSASNVVISGYFVATGTSTIVGCANANTNNGTGIFDNISVKSIAGNHAISYNTTTARPELSARVNLLTYSEQINGGVGTWFNNNSPTVTTNNPDPNGTNTASKIVVNGTSVNQGVYVNVTAIPAGQSGLFSVWLRGEVGGEIVQIGDAGSRQNVTLTTSWQRFSNPSHVLTSTFHVIYAKDNTAMTFYAWGADCRPSNIGTSVPAYQRIADQYTYDSNGFPRYLIANGTATGMYTPNNLNLSGTDKVTVFAGVRKLSDAASGIVCEFSVNWNNNTGTFISVAPDVTAPNGDYVAASRGTAASNINQFARSAITPAPVTNVVTATHDIPGDLSAIRLNGAANGTNGTGDKGLGNFGTYPLYIGARNNTSNWLNGYLYSLIVVGAASTAAQISSTESWINVKEGTVY